ncbi:pinin family protein [Oxalobacter formigenes]|uniref:hypothetical protein n=1 Tax=Oxalobacter formigenes TaxID=847 RepID=UPI0022AE54D9|nr:hypothetical protein [Oxalobacter formigenes]WAW06083.1 pinin family protein [Oxalobacter formigenes]
MFGIDDLAIAGLIASLAGSAISYNSQQQAAKRANSESLAAMRRQQDFQRQAEQAAMDRAQEYKTENRQEEQQAIQSEMEQEYLVPAMSAQAINADTATTQGNVSGDYSAAKAKSDANVDNLAKTFASLMAKTNSAKQLRLNEGYKMADTASNIGRLQSFSQGQSAVDKMKIQDAANSGSTGNFLGNLLSAAGSYGMVKGGNFSDLFPGSNANFKLPGGSYIGTPGAGFKIRG